jgi:hypothetical protein
MSQVFGVMLLVAAAASAFDYAQAAPSDRRGAPALGDTTDRLARVVSLPDGAAIRLNVTIGRVTVSGWDRSEVSVEVVRRAPDAAALERLPLEIETTPGVLAIRAVQRDGGHDAALRSDVVLRVPAAARIAALDLFEGDLELSGLSGPCAARVERGDITARGLSGAVRLETAIGAVRLEGAALSVPDGLIRVRTFNVDVDIALAAPPEHARILALSMGGTITSDIPLTRRERWGPRWAEATIGDGGPLLSVDVVNGDIAIRVRK